jgi:hypothetical protein
MYRNKQNNNESTTKLHRGPTIDASYQVSVHLASGLQRRRLTYEKSMDDRRRTPSDGKSKQMTREKVEIVEQK